MPGKMKVGKLSLGKRAFDVESTLYCGQIFHWSAIGEGEHLGTIGDSAVWLREDPKKKVLEYAGVSRDLLECYLGLDLKLDEIIATFPSEDEHMQAALAYAPGLRVCRQPHWECLATFITSSLKQVPHIRQISLTLRERFGQECHVGEHRLWAYPTPERLAEAGETALRECGLGYRAKSLALAAERIAGGEIDLEAIAELDDGEARAALCALHGVGEKIADCVLLFAYGRLAAFPIDVWVERVLKHLYAPRGKKRKWPRAQMQAFASKFFGPYAGYAQQYLFHYARHHDKVLFGDR